jgi:hypothetical protein
MITAKDGSIYDRALVESRPQQLRTARRLRLHADAEDRGPRRLGQSYVHINRIGSANLLGINGPQVVRAACEPGRLATRQLPADRAGLSRAAWRLRRSSTR